MDQILQDNCMFAYVHFTQEEGWCPVREAMTTHTNFFFLQQEHKGITSPSNRIVVTSLLHQPDAEDLMGGIIKSKNQIKSEDTPPLVNDLEIRDIFKDKDKEEGDSVIDSIEELVLQTVGLLF